MFVPAGVFIASCFLSSEAAIKIQEPSSSSTRRVFSSTSATEAIEGRASPRNPSVFILKRSWADEIFEVAWRSKAMRASIGDMPFPSSIT